MSKFDKVLEPWFNDDDKKYLLCITYVYGEESEYNICDSIPEINESIDDFCSSNQVDLENSFIVPIDNRVPLKEYIKYCKSKGFQFSEC